MDFGGFHAVMGIHLFVQLYTHTLAMIGNAPSCKLHSLCVTGHVLWTESLNRYDRSIK